MWSYESSQDDIVDKIEDENEVQEEEEERSYHEDRSNVQMLFPKENIVGIHMKTSSIKLIQAKKHVANVLQMIGIREKGSSKQTNGLAGYWIKIILYGEKDDVKDSSSPSTNVQSMKGIHLLNFEIIFMSETSLTTDTKREKTFYDSPLLDMTR